MQINTKPSNKKKLTHNQAEEEEKEGDDETSGFVDVTAPHPEFVLSPPNTRVSSREFEDICEDLAPPNGKGELKNPQHPFLRALRRGVAWCGMVWGGVAWSVPMCMYSVAVFWVGSCCGYLVRKRPAVKDVYPCGQIKKHPGGLLLQLVRGFLS